jgi:polyhydroxyalkanoate synthase
VLETLLARGERRARIEANRALLRFVNGIDWLIRDPKTVVGRTPYEVVYKRDKLEVRRYHAGSVRHRYDVPVMLVPPLMVKPFIFDLMPGRSLAAFLLQEGFPVYLVDFGEPEDADAYITLDDYVLDWIPMACEAVKTDAGSAELSLLGYCMGGLFSLSYVATTGDRSVRNIVSIAAPIDTRKMGLFAWLAKMAGGQVEFVTNRLGNVPGGLSSTVFRLLTPMKNVTRYADLFLNMWNREYVNGFDAMNQWVGQFIDYPQAAFEQFTHEFMQHNKLVRGKMKFGNKIADLKRVRASLLVFAGRSDQIAPMAAVQAVLDTVSSDDTEFRSVAGGHMGVFAGASAEQHVWEPAAQWLAQRSRAALPVPSRQKARKSGRRRRPSPRKKVAASA